ncbi:MAG: PEP/pyruvate-binding domain-containing protein [Rhizobiaceae bacterium]|nr:PEP/pyruvate-binding domain-containing protein [Rhizobiaceae bacterium]
MTIIKHDDEIVVEQVGGKTAALMRLVAQGFPVPAFFGIKRECFNKRSMKKEFREQLLAQVAEIGPGPYAVRSSAVEEDGASSSHAGQFLSILNVNKKDLPAACFKVFKSGSVGNVEEYRKSLGLEGEGGGTSVLVQQMVDATTAGVMFTADPVSRRRDRIIVSAIEGLGERLVGGEEDGESYTLSNEGALLESDEGNELLSQEKLSALTELANSVEQACGAPQDIEWAFACDKLFLLQSRPITTELLDAPVEDNAITIFDNSNIVESYPGLVSPLTFSFAQYAYARVYRAFVNLLGVSPRKIAENSAVFENMLSRIDGRVYYNLINWYRALALLPGFSINRAYMEVMMGVSEPLPEEITATIGPPPAKGIALAMEWLRVSKSAFFLLFEACLLSSTRKDFYKRLNSALKEPAETLEKKSLSDLAVEYRRIEADLLDRWDAPLINDFLCMIGFGASRKILEKWAGPQGLEIHNDIMIGQGDIVSAEPAQRIREMGAMLEGHDTLREELANGNGENLARHPELPEAVDEYLGKFSDRCTEELKLESITLDQDPTPLYIAIAAGSNLNQPSENEERDSLGELLKSNLIKRVIARGVMSWAKARVRDRENLRFERTRIFGRARKLFLAVGKQFHAHGLIDAPNDIFMLTVQEILGAIEGFAVTPNLKGLVELRRAEFERVGELPDPDERISISGAMVVNHQQAPKSISTDDENSMERSGTGCSAGTVKAVARVITDPRKQGLNKGDILVARHTDPGWIAVFVNASAIVVERGSLLSHSAIVARELGIPCVVALKGAMSWISDGETIEVNGSNGIVRRIG